MTAKPPPDPAAPPRSPWPGSAATAPARPPEVTARRLVARSRIFRVEAMDLIFSNGAQRTFERILGGRDSVMVVPVLGAETLLLIREYAAGTDDYQLGFPKGIVDPGEDILTAAGRELREEVGYAARRLCDLQRVTLAPGYIQHGTRLVLAQDLYPSPAPGDEPEPLEVVPWPLTDLDGLLARPDFTEARSIAALFLARRYLQQAHQAPAADGKGRSAPGNASSPSPDETR
ncbi:MAG: ADP compounds hydrolase NudE [Chromatiaceae bacterium]|nr:MAG: ADP compounds hydrolase NudE [Chromatiaceae bacterium]